MSKPEKSPHHRLRLEPEPQDRHQIQYAIIHPTMSTLAKPLDSGMTMCKIEPHDFLARTK